MTGISFYCFLWRLISVRRVRASNGRQNRFLYRSHRNEQSRKNIVFMRLCGVSGILFSRRGEQIILLFFIAAVTVRSAGGQGIRPHKACRAAGLTHGIVRMTQSQRQVVRSRFLHQCADTAPGKPPFIAAAARVFVKVRQPFHVRPFWYGQNKCAKQGTVDDIHLKAVRCQLPPNRYPRTHGAVSSPEILL